MNLHIMTQTDSSSQRSQMGADCFRLSDFVIIARLLQQQRWETSLFPLRAARSLDVESDRVLQTCWV